MHTPLFVVTYRKDIDQIPTENEIWETVDREGLGDYIQSNNESGRLWDEESFHNIFKEIFPEAKFEADSIHVTLADIKKYFKSLKEKIRKIADDLTWEDIAKRREYEIYEINKVTGRYASPIIDTTCQYYTHMAFASSLYNEMLDRKTDNLTIKLIDIYDMHY